MVVGLRKLSKAIQHGCRCRQLHAVRLCRAAATQCTHINHRSQLGTTIQKSPVCSDFLDRTQVVRLLRPPVVQQRHHTSSAPTMGKRKAPESATDVEPADVENTAADVAKEAPQEDAGGALVNPARVRVLKAGDVQPGPAIYWLVPQLVRDAYPLLPHHEVVLFRSQALATSTMSCLLQAA